MVSVILGNMTVPLRQHMLEIQYRRTGDDVTWWFAADHLNDMLRLTGAERKAICALVLEDGK